MYKLNDTWIRVGAILFLTFIQLFNNGLLPFFVTGNDGGQVLYVLAYNLVYWETNRAILLWLYKRMDGHPTTARRWLIVTACCVPATLLLRIGSLYARHSLFGMDLPPLPDMLESSFIAVLGTLWLIIGTYDILYNNTESVKTERETQELIAADLQSRYDSLMGQVNPHFLFNNLNALSVLISKDPERADRFVEEMSSVYRYLLNSTEEMLTPLHREIRFIHSYLHLLKTRFGEGLEHFIEIDPEMDNRKIPPMSLQLLVENAVKHNLVAPEEPLKLKIFTAGTSLVVTNNLQRKNKTVVSSGIGLSNIISRYRLLNQPPAEIEETNTSFTVMLPLINA